MRWLLGLLVLGGCASPLAWQEVYVPLPGAPCIRLETVCDSLLNQQRTLGEVRGREVRP